MSKTNQSAASGLLRELAVPAVMLFCAALYWADAYGLSAKATVFPIALTLVLVVLLGAIVGRAAWSYLTLRAESSAGGPTSGADRQDSFEFMRKRWATIILAGLTVFVWEATGAAVAILLYAVCLLLILGERRPAWLIGLPLVTAVGLTYLFKVMLYLRLPEAAWLPGNWL